MTIEFFFGLSYVLQFLGFIGIVFAWWRAFRELHAGIGVPRTRMIMFIITTVALVAYVVPSLITVCYFVTGCFSADYRDYMRIFSGFILFLYGLFKFLLYYTKEKHPFR